MARLWGLPNHWAVIIEITSGFINVQFEENGVQVSDHTSMADAARASLAIETPKFEPHATVGRMEVSMLGS